MFQRIAIILTFLVLGSPFVVASEYDPQVFCELSGEHGDNPDAVADDVALLREALIATHDLLPSDLRAHARVAPFFINHTHVPPTKLYLGWSAEDDPEYKYPDQDLYPKGTIKSNCTERCIQFLNFTRNELGGLNEHSGARAFMTGFFVHEFTHDTQYMERPVRDLNSKPPEVACPEGLCDRGLVLETRLKIQYELEAIARHLEFVSTEELAMLARDYDRITTEHPDWFQDGGMYSLLGADFGQYYLKSLEAVRAAGGFAGSTAVVYNGQYRVPELVWFLHEYRKSGSCHPGVLASVMVEWSSFMNQGADTEKLRGVGPYIGLAKERFLAELKELLESTSCRD